MSNVHQAPVMSLRWGPLGRFLASASDEGDIVLWHLRPRDDVSAAAAGYGFGFGDATGEVPLENWCRAVTFNGHTLSAYIHTHAVARARCSACRAQLHLTWTRCQTCTTCRGARMAPCLHHLRSMALL